MSVSARTIIEPLAAAIPGLLFIAAYVNLIYHGGHHIDILWVGITLLILIPGFIISFVVAIRKQTPIWWVVTAINSSPLLIPIIMLLLGLLLTPFIR